MSVPLHVAGVTTFEELILPVSISFEDFYSKVCAKMDLEPQTTSLGYRFNKDLRRTPYKDLTNEHHLHAAMNKGADLIDRARTRRVVLEIQNMVSSSVDPHRKFPVLNQCIITLIVATSPPEYRWPEAICWWRSYS